MTRQNVNQQNDAQLYPDAKIFLDKLINAQNYEIARGLCEHQTSEFLKIIAASLQTAINELKIAASSEEGKIEKLWISLGDVAQGIAFNAKQVGDNAQVIQYFELAALSYEKSFKLESAAAMHMFLAENPTIVQNNRNVDHYLKAATLLERVANQLIYENATGGRKNRQGKIVSVRNRADYYRKKANACVDERARALSPSGLTNSASLSPISEERKPLFYRHDPRKGTRFFLATDLSEATQISSGSGFLRSSK